MSNSRPNFRVVHRFGVSTTPRVIQCLNTGKLSDPLINESHIARFNGHTFHILKRHHATRKLVVVEPYVGNWPRLTFFFKRCMEVFA